MLSPVHDRLVANGGYLREVSGWEGADWFAGAGRTPEATPTWGRADWFEQWEAEHRTIRERRRPDGHVVHGEVPRHRGDAGALLDHVSAGAVDGETERITYTQWLDDDGKIEADLTVTKLGEDDFWVVASDTAHGHVLAWMRRHVGDADVAVDDVTEDYAQLNVQGPLSRDVLAGLTDRRPLERGVPLPQRALGRGRRGAGAAGADHLRRRTRLRVVRARRRRLARLRRVVAAGAGAGRSQDTGRCGWRRPIATSATTSTTPTTCSRPGSGSPSTSTSPPTSSDATRCVA